MALIKCPECGKEVSDRAASCIHCGFPFLNTGSAQQVKELQSSMPANSAPLSTTPVLCDRFSLFSASDEYVNIECKKCKKVYKYNRQKYFTEVTNERCTTNTPIRCSNCGNTANAYSRFLRPKSEPIVEKLRCPRCSSTLVTTGQRGFSIWTGFLGSSKTVNRCGKCGHVWQP